ncbi:hypothetical protein GCM10020219_073910 [Nonomuraea dietziae]
MVVLRGEDALGRRDAVHPGHPDVHEDHVGAGGRRHADGLLAARRLSHDVQVGYGADERRQARTDENLIVDDEYLDHAFGSPGGSEG